ncbi:hypothetical protein AB0M20_33455 [Actinoplanes sp. NPDC051633]|uniref:hypothetical protein n=1 Tax=Actinoplanes sp. NPDC051633 TaxID=3155670 RepID=UPI00343C85DF
MAWFGEILPSDAFESAVESATNAEALITVGTSGLVQPAAETQILAHTGGQVIRVNPTPTPFGPSSRDKPARYRSRGAPGLGAAPAPVIRARRFRNGSYERPFRCLGKIIDKHF